MSQSTTDMKVCSNYLAYVADRSRSMDMGERNGDEEL